MPATTPARRRPGSRASSPAACLPVVALRRLRRALSPASSLPVLLRLEKLVDPHTSLNGFVVDELEFRRSLHVSQLGDLGLEDAVSVLQTRERLLSLLLVP